MNIDDYQDWTDSTAVYPEANEGTERELNYLITALGGESGELQNAFKKLIRSGDVTLDGFAKIELTIEQERKLMHELGDIMWYAVRVAKVLGYNASGMLDLNYDKLTERKAQDSLKNHDENDA